MDEYLKYCGTANTIGVPYQIITPAEIKKLWPLVELGDGVATPKVIGALYHPDDGHIAPVDLTMALRKGVRNSGAEIYEQTLVEGATQLPGGEWTVRTDKGDITCEHVVCASGNYARKTGRMFGLNVPASKRYTVAKNEEAYREVFSVHYPDEERHDGPPAKTSPIYDKLAHMGAVFGQRYGWERANWFAPPGVERKDRWSFRRSNYFEHVGTECRNMRERVGVIDLAPFAKHEIGGPGAEAWLDQLVANKVPVNTGRIALCHALTPRGGIRSEFTITKLGDKRFYVASAGAGDRFDGDYLQQMLPADGSVRLHNTTTHRGCFVLASPRSREVLARLTDTSLDNQAFPWLTGQVIEVGHAVDVYALRVDFIGELGWELHFPIEYAHSLFDALFEAGKEFGIGTAGMCAMESMRLEKSYRMWGTDLSIEYSPFEASLDRFVRLNKGDFIGKAALERQLAEGIPHRFVTLEVHGVTDADPLGNEPLYVGGRLAGRATAGYDGHVLGQAAALRRPLGTVPIPTSPGRIHNTRACRHCGAGRRRSAPLACGVARWMPSENYPDSVFAF